MFHGTKNVAADTGVGHYGKWSEGPLLWSDWLVTKQAEKLKSRKMKDFEGWWRWKMMKDDGGKVEWLILRGWGGFVTDRLMDICECRVAFATEKEICKHRLGLEVT